MKKNNVIVFLNGEMPKRILRSFPLEHCYKICADGAANKLKTINITPNIILGDFDSIKKSTIEYYKKMKIEMRKIDEQETTDFEKSLMYAVENGLNDILIFGAISRRPDHTLNNFSIMKRYYKILNMKIIDKKFEIFFIDKKIEFDYKTGRTISLMPLPFARGIKTEGLEYALNNEDLEFGIREGTLNISNSNKVKIIFCEGNLLLFKKHFL
jgi:thiamine pyrophosphokinase